MDSENDDRGVPTLTQERLEYRVEHFLRTFDHSLLFEPRPTPVEDICNWLTSEYGIQVNLSARLGRTRDGRRIFGEFSLHDRSISIDESLKDRGKLFRETVAHEIAHLVLHRFVDPQIMLGGEVGIIVDAEKESVDQQVERREVQRKIENQADAFTRALLLPRATVPKVLVEKQDDLGIRRGRGRVWVDWKRQALADLKVMTSHIGARFRVDRKMAEERLEELGLIEYEEAPRTTQRVSDILRGFLRKAG